MSYTLFLSINNLILVFSQLYYHSVFINILQIKVIKWYNEFKKVTYMRQGIDKIITERLILRKFVETDVFDFYNNWANDKEVTKYLSWPHHENLEVTKIVLNNFIKSYDNMEYNWAIELDNSVIGNISTVKNDYNNKTCEIGYVIGKKYWNNGYMTEALKAVIKYLFAECYLKISARHDVNNPSSGKVMEKAGMKYKETIYKCVKNNQGIVDCKYYEITK